MSRALFKITEEDVQHIATRKLRRKLTENELYSVQKGIEFGLEYCWDEVVVAAIDEIQDSKTG